MNLFFIHFWAHLVKRFRLYARNKKSLAIEILAPLCMVMFGFTMGSLEFFKDSPNRQLVPDLYPGVQRILFNEDTIVTSDINPQSFAANLPY